MLLAPRFPPSPINFNQSDDNRWLTYKQAQNIDAQVRKGEKGTTIQYWKFNEEKVKKKMRLAALYLMNKVIQLKFKSALKSYWTQYLHQ
ncbi:DNA primase traC [Legionella worsleiensis]|uniref:DNA primase traC n=1 Tax=Legionella worsleiensis TaxID=45076 RepID=A0A0W1AGH8_9GAMM|nr:DNA primase traC [Legionella worsleiensis]STY32764.1 DNA primase traC [Legionella worsleiensis]